MCVLLKLTTQYAKHVYKKMLMQRAFTVRIFIYSNTEYAYVLKGLKTGFAVNNKKKCSFILGVNKFCMWYKSNHNKITLLL